MSSKKLTARKRAEMSERKRSRPMTKQSVIKKNKLLIGLILVIVLIVVVSVIIVFNPFGEEDKTDNGDTPPSGGNPIATFETSMGTIKVELYEDKVPNTCANFINLANDGFYDGLVFHRVMDDFMIQSGGFETDGTQKESPYGQIELEIHQDLRHVDGAIAMARQGQDMTDPTYFNTATSQFYICDGPQHGLDDYYAAFGKVTDGMDVVRSIASAQTTSKYGMSNWPVTDVIINSITIGN